MQEGEPARVGVDFIEEFCGATIATLRSGRLRGLLAQMPKAKAKKQKSGAKRSASRRFFGRRKWIWIPLLVLLFIPAVQVAVVRFVDPPRTLPMWIEQVSVSGAKTPLRYHWIPFGADTGDISKASLDFGGSAVLVS